MSRPIHFEIQADDLERAKAFYADVFGWTYEDYGQFTGSPYWGVHTGDPGEPGIDGGLMPRPAPAPAAGSGANAARADHGRRGLRHHRGEDRGRGGHGRRFPRRP